LGVKCYTGIVYLSTVMICLLQRRSKTLKYKRRAAKWPSLSVSSLVVRTAVTFRKSVFSMYCMYVCMYVYRFQNVFLRCPTPRLLCFLSSHWPSFRFISCMAFFIPSIQFFFGLPCIVFMYLCIVFYCIYVLFDSQNKEALFSYTLLTFSS
jgi:hypothetical protein